MEYISSPIKAKDFFVNSIYELRRRFSIYLGYKIVFFLLAAIVLSPLSSFIFSFLTRTKGQTAITNEYVISYLFSLRGALSILIWGVLTFFLIFIEQAGIIFICSNIHFQKKPTVPETIKFILRKIPAILRLGGELFLRYVLFSLPFLIVWALTFFLLLSDYDINYYLAKRPPAFWVAAVIGGINLIAYLVLLLGYLTRWIFSLHLVLLKQGSLHRIFQRSTELASGIGIAILRLLMLWTLGTGLFVMITTTLLAVINEFILALLGSSPTLAVPIMAFLYAFDFIAATFFISLGIPVLSIMLTKVYYRRLSDKGLTVSKTVTHDSHEKQSQNFTRFQRRIPWIVLAVFLVCLMILGASMAEDFTRPDTVEVTAHRGSSMKAPENSLSAIRQAIVDEADYAEIDVQETADGVIVVVHDSDLMRITGQPLKLWETPYEQVKELDAGSWFSPEFKDERIPTLEETIEVVRGKIKLNIELKFNGHAKQLTERVVQIVQQQNFIDECVITSLNYPAVLKAKELDNRLQVGYIMYGTLGSPFTLQSDFFSVSKDLISESFIAKSHEQDRDVHVWTYSDGPNAMERFIYLGVDNIITDYPAELVAVLKRRAEMDDFDRVKENFMRWMER